MRRHRRGVKNTPRLKADWARASFTGDVAWRNYAYGYTSVPPAVGRLYYSTPGGPSRCSGTVVAVNVVLTAAHCVVNSATGQFYSNWVFAPQQNGNSFPYGIWTARTATAWTYYWAPSLRNLPGSGGLGFLPMDYAFVVLNPQNGLNVGNHTGNYGLVLNSALNAPFTIEGYPATGPFASNCPSNSFFCRSWYCWSPYGGFAYYPAAPGFFEIAASCYTGQGHSGGPWFQPFAGGSYIASDFSNGPFHNPGYFVTAWGPYFNDWTGSLLNYARTL